jgi:hypothetical protein
MWSNIIYNAANKQKSIEIDHWYNTKYKEIMEGEKMQEQKKINDNERKIIVGETKTFERVKVPMNIYPGVVVGIDDVPEGPYGKRVAIRFEFFYNGKNYVLSKFYYLNLTSKTSLGQLFKTLTKTDLVAGSEVDVNVLIGCRANLLVKDFTNSEGITFSVVDAVLPFVEGVKA